MTDCELFLNCEIIGYPIGIGHEKHVIIGYQYRLGEKKDHHDQHFVTGLVLIM